MTGRLSKTIVALAAAVACTAPLAAAAQSIGYGSVDGGGDDAVTEQPVAPDGGSRGDRGGREARESRGYSYGGHEKDGYGVKITPYIEAAQIVTERFAPNNDTLTYSVLAAQVDASVRGRHNGGSASLRYEHSFGWGKADSKDAVSGVANGYATVAPGIKFHAGGFAARARLEGNGVSVLSPIGEGDSVTQIYSVYAGPSVDTHAGPVAVNANYRFGYTKVKALDAVVLTPGQAPIDIADEDKVHMADVHAGVKPGEALPVGLGAGANYYREDIANLDQRVENFSAQGEVTVPVTNTTAVVGAVGYEKVQISSRDAVRDAQGHPLIGSDGRYVTDQSAPRVLAYDTSGLIWDVGVMWRPSRRTAFEAHVGRRYGSVSYRGSLAWQPNMHSSIALSVYDNMAGFGGQLSRSLLGLPTNFDAVRNPLSGGIGGCVASLEGGNCLTNSLGSLNSSAFRARGVMATYSVALGALNAGVGAGYDRRRFIAAPGTVLALANGSIQENYWLAAYLDGKIDSRSGFRTELYANWFQSSSNFGGDDKVLGATASYYRNLTRHLSAVAALGLDGIDRDAPLTDDWAGSALLGVRYTF